MSLNSYIMLTVLKRIKRGYNHFYTKWQSFLHEKRYSAHGTRVKYMFYKESKSNVLLVSFPACAPNTAKYNYMRTLLPFKCNKLFLLDDFGENHQGCYLAEDKVEKCTSELLHSIIEWCTNHLAGAIFCPLKVIFLGSSKGGYSALNFSFIIPDVHVVIGAPQYYLGSYLDKENTKVNLTFLIGNITEEGKKELNDRLKNRIRTSVIQPKVVYFHYSNVEHTYEEHVKDMLYDLKERGIEVVEDVHSYAEHSGLKDYYPPFLVKTIENLIDLNK